MARVSDDVALDTSFVKHGKGQFICGIDGRSQILMVFGLAAPTQRLRRDTFEFWRARRLSGLTMGRREAARFNVPIGIAVDSSGTLYVTDAQNIRDPHDHGGRRGDHVRRRVGAFGSADGAGSAARFGGPQGAAVDGAGNVYVADLQSHDPEGDSRGRVSTFAGLAGTAEAPTAGQRRAIQFPRGWPWTSRATCMSATPGITRSGRSRPAAS